MRLLTMAISPGRRHKHKIRTRCGLLATALAWNCASPPAPPPSPTVLNISTGSRGGYSYDVASALGKTLSTRVPRYAVGFQTTDGAIGSVASIQEGISDCGFTNANIAYEAFAGHLPDDPRKYDRLRGVALVQNVPLNLLTRQDSPVRDLRDLRGRRLGVGSSDGGTYRLAMLVLAAYGLGRDSTHINDAVFAKSLGLFLKGELDGLFLLSAQGSDTLTRVTQNAAHIVPLAGPEMERLRQEYPFVRPALIPAGTYAGQKDPVRTVGVDTLILCRADLSPEHVQQITSAWFQTAQDLLENGSMAEAVSPEFASATPIPLHEGATRYYRSKPWTH
jgi:TRAP transporter TAXI family solute receptor